jgi:8-oxo-dGTP pyrophosphatase MutT (NUDIX family)
MPDELVDIIDQQNQIIGQLPKSVVHQQGLRHRVAAVLLQRPDGKFLIPTAAAHKAEAGGLFHSAAGHIPTGETPLQAAQRELSEEVGLSISQDLFQPLGSYWFEKDFPTRKEKEYFTVFLAIYKPKPEEIKLNEEQINEQWLSPDELKDILTHHPEKLSNPLRITLENLFDFKS